VPELGARKPVSIFMVVDLPAPLGPRKPSTSPGWTLNDRSSTAVCCAKRLVRFLISIMASHQCGQSLARRSWARARPAKCRRNYKKSDALIATEWRPRKFTGGYRRPAARPAIPEIVVIPVQAGQQLYR